MQVKADYDVSVGCAYLNLSNQKEAMRPRSVEVKIAKDGVFGSLIIDVDRADGKIIGIEILGVETILKPDTIQALKDGKGV